MSVHTHVYLSFKCIIIQFAAYTATDGCTLMCQGVTSHCRLSVYCYCVRVCVCLCVLRSFFCRITCVLTPLPMEKDTELETLSSRI